MSKKFPLRAAWYGLIMVASVLPAVALAPWLGQQAHELLLERAMLREQIFHNEVETRLSLETERLITVLNSKADPIGIIWSNQQDFKLLNGLIKNVTARESVISSVAIYDNHARFITGIKHDDHTFATLKNDMAEFAVPMHGRSFLGTPHKLPDNHYEFTISVPILNNLKPVGIILATVNIAEFWAAINSKIPEHASEIYLIDSRGTLLIHHAMTHHVQGDLMSDKEIVRSLLAGQNWHRHEIYNGFEERDVFGIASLVPTLKWGVISEISSTTIMEPIISALKTLTIIVFLLHILFGLISLLFTRHLLSPISDLARVVKQATEGDYSQQAKSSPYEEINSLTTNFNTMITEIELRETALQKLSQAIDQAGEAILITNRDGLLEYVNPAFCKTTGYCFDEAIGNMPKTLIGSGMQDKSFYKELWSKILSGHSWEGTLTNSRKDGSFYPVLMNIAPIYSGEMITHFVAIQQDMSRQNLLEEQLRQSQKMESLGTLVGGIAHDFNNLLGGMTGNLYLAKIKAQNSPEAVEKIKNVEMLSFKAADLISQLLTFARKSAVQMQEINLSEHYKESLKLLKAGIPENIKLKAEICDDDLPVQGDKTQLHQILMNLLSNARDAVRESINPYIHLTIKPFTATDAFRSAHPHHADCDDYALVSVSDSGHGISDEQLEHIFEPFYTTKDVGQGSGLGLSMVYGAMHTHNAIIDVTSQLDHGTAFHLYFPLVDVAVADTVETSFEAVTGNGESILIVDDEFELCETCGEILEHMGYRVFTASDGKQGLRRFEQHSDSIALILTDVVMPKMSGAEMVNSIRKIKPEIPVIFMTGYDKNMLAGEIDFDNSIVMPKPVEIDLLGTQIGLLLKGNR